MSTDITVAIMAGGKSSRMGRNKALLTFDSKPMIEGVRDKVANLGQELILITNTPDVYAHLQLPMFADLYPEHGPLAGIYTAVAQATHPHVLIVACDMPWLNPALLRHLISLRQSADIVVPRWQKFPEPMHAVYSKACLPAMQESLGAQRLKITSFFGKVNVRFVDREEIERFDANGRSFANINTPDDLENAAAQ